MMIRPVVRYLLQKRALKDDRSPSIVHGALIDSVAVLATQDTKEFEVAQSYVNELKHRGIKTVDFFVGFANAKKQEAHTGPSKVVAFNPQSFSLLGGLKSASLESLVKNKYDVLIDLSNGKSLECDLLISKIDARWKAGKLMSGREYLLDFMIDEKGSDAGSLIHHLDKYLTNFNTPNAA